VIAFATKLAFISHCILFHKQMTEENEIQKNDEIATDVLEIIYYNCVLAFLLKYTLNLN